jgi:hypothetical protein
LGSRRNTPPVSLEGTPIEIAAVKISPQRAQRGTESATRNENHQSIKLKEKADSFGMQ